MIDKELLKLLGGNKKYIFYTVGFMVLGLFANLTVVSYLAVYGCSILSILHSELKRTDQRNKNAEVHNGKTKENNFS